MTGTSNWPTPMPILLQNNFGGDSIAIGIVSLSSPASWDLGPRQHLFGGNSALDKTNQHSSVRVALRIGGA